MVTTVSGGELVVRTLLAAKVRHVFGLHGAHLETIFQSLARHDVPILDTRQGKSFRLLRCLSCEKVCWTEER